jgi:phage shock protein PspC (stress-responsive transcriptional regulator)
MNKTVSINLGGLFFHIDEDAFQKLNRYFDAIKRSLSPDGKDEIMNDIESRIAELLSEKIKNDKQVVGTREVDEVIAVMGQPEDYRIDEDTTQQSSNTYYNPGYNPTRTKKFYRDSDNGIVSGVCAGIGHYFRIDPLWIRIIFIISLFPSFGTTVFVYILLWILIPKAVTTTEKLEMTGEPINISNIEKKVREEIDSLAEKFQHVDYNKIGATASRGAERMGNALGEIFSTIFKALAKVIGAIITIFSALALCGLIIGFFSILFSSTFVDTRFSHFTDVFNYVGVPMWGIALLGLLTIGIPFFFLLVLGLKILVDNLRPLGSIAKYTLLALWIIALGVSTYLGVMQATQVSYDGKTSKKEQLYVAQQDTLFVKFRHNDFYQKNIDWDDDEFSIRQDTAGNDIIYSNNIDLYFLKTDNDSPYIQVEKVANGSSSSNARNIAEKIKYNFTIKGNTLILDNYFITDIRDKFRNQHVEVYVYLPKGLKFKPDASVKIYDETDNSFFDLYFESDRFVYQMGEENVKCLNCPPKDDEDSEPVHARGYIDYNGNDTLTVKGAVQIIRDSIRFEERSVN